MWLRTACVTFARHCYSPHRNCSASNWLGRRENFFTCHSLFPIWIALASETWARVCVFSQFSFSFILSAFSPRTFAGREWNAAYLCLNCAHRRCTRKFSFPIIFDAVRMQSYSIAWSALDNSGDEIVGTDRSAQRLAVRKIDRRRGFFLLAQHKEKTNKKWGKVRVDEVCVRGREHVLGHRREAREKIVAFL